MREWSIQEVKTWISQLFDVNIGQRFFTEGITGKALEMLEENHLKDMGIGRLDSKSNHHTKELSYICIFYPLTSLSYRLNRSI